MGKVNFILGFHCHQPVGNFEFVFKKAFQRSYKPLLATMEKTPDFPVTWHFSGPVIDWLEKNESKYIDRLALLLNDHDHEIMTGGYYEPIISAVSKEDALGQIEKMNSYIKSRFGVTPRGMWLAERVWEPGMPSLLNEAGVEYITLDDYHFNAVGLKQSDLTGYYVTEDQGKKLNVFPISQKLRYLMPFRKVEETIKFLRQYANEKEDTLFVLADDGEKFGLWPGTSEIVFKKKWLRNFVFRLLEESDWINVTTFSKWIDSHPPKGSIYLPDNSYFEMGKWSMVTEDRKKIDSLLKNFRGKEKVDEIKTLLKTGFWRNFMIKYPEIDHMQKRMMQVSRNVRESKKSNSEALDAVWKAQTNCPYWHGVFGGIYLPHLRDSVYRNLIKAEKSIIDSLPMGLSRNDFNMNGEDDYFLQNKNLLAIIEPAKGGSVTECDYRPADFNIINSMSRREEPYHNDIRAKLKKKGSGGKGGKSIHELKRKVHPEMGKHLHYDSLRKGWFQDHILNTEENFTKYQKGEAKHSYDLRSERFKAAELDSLNGWSLDMMAYFSPENGVEISLRKTLWMKRNGSHIRGSYEMNCESGSFKGKFLPEFNFSMLGSKGLKRRIEIAGKKLSLDKSGIFLDEKAVIYDEYQHFKVTFTAKGANEMWLLPVKTVTQSETNYEMIYQSSELLPVYKFNLKTGESLKFEINIRFEKIIK